MDDDAGRVEDAPQPRPPRAASSSRSRAGEVAGIGAGADLLARALEHRARRVDRERIAEPARELVHRRQVAQLHAESLLRVGLVRLVRIPRVAAAYARAPCGASRGSSVTVSSSRSSGEIIPLGERRSRIQSSSGVQ